MFFTDSCFQLTNAAIFSLENGNSKKNLKIVISDISYYSMIKVPDFTNTTENAKGIQNMSPLKGCHTYNKGVACHCSHYTEMGCLLRSTNCQSVGEGTSDRKKNGQVQSLKIHVSIEKEHRFFSLLTTFDPSPKLERFI